MTNRRCPFPLTCSWAFRHPGCARPLPWAAVAYPYRWGSVMNPLRRQRQFVSELTRGGWIVLLLFFCIAASQFIVAHFCGRAWGFVASVADLGVWLLARPWKLGLLSGDSRQEVFILGTIGFIGWVARAAILYWRI